MLEKLHTMTDGAELAKALVEDTRKNHASQDPYAFALGYLAAYVAGINQARIESDGDEIRPLSDDEVDKLLVNVSITKLEKLLKDRRAELGIQSPWCAFPGCPNKRHTESLFCSIHTEDDCSDCDHSELFEDFEMGHSVSRCAFCGTTVKTP